MHEKQKLTVANTKPSASTVFTSSLVRITPKK
jgi:hypothetical protein